MIKISADLLLSDPINDRRWFAPRPHLIFGSDRTRAREEQKFQLEIISFHLTEWLDNQREITRRSIYKQIGVDARYSSPLSSPLLSPLIIEATEREEEKSQERRNSSSPSPSSSPQCVVCCVIDDRQMNVCVAYRRINSSMIWTTFFLALALALQGDIHDEFLLRSLLFQISALHLSNGATNERTDRTEPVSRTRAGRLIAQVSSFNRVKRRKKFVTFCSLNTSDYVIPLIINKSLFCR